MVASAVHVAIAAALLTGSRRDARPAAAPAALAERATEIGIETASEPPGALAAAAERGEPRSPEAAASAPSRPAMPAPAAPDAVIAMEGNDGRAAETAPGAREDGAAASAWFHPTGTVDLGLGVAGAMKVGTLRPGEGEAPRAAPAPARPVSSTGGLVEALDSGDVARGLGHAGPVRSAVDAAAHRAEAPTFGVATFTVSLGSDGSVQVALAGANADRPGWDALRGAIREAVEKAPKRIAVPGRGVRVTVRVEAREQFASGAAPTPDRKQGVAASGSLGAVHETKDRVDFELPSATLAYKTRSCGVGATVNPTGVSLGGGCEAGVAMRVVSTKIVAEERL
ncbi:MAG: hypothetical protein JWP97_1848 [Labilithrix sp.]|nr:hypothetical protein [Labilithrix sp.]